VFRRRPRSVAILLYRLVSFWLPIPAGLVAGIFHRVKYGGERKTVDG
jgi:uncharacterized membrane protein YbhN (UPF0104 family)